MAAARVAVLLPLEQDFVTCGLTVSPEGYEAGIAFVLSSY
jgi:hypothetical protein